MVECGACDEKFKVEGAALVRQKKHYPGEKSESNADAFATSPSADSIANQDVAFQTANYQNVSAEYAQPPKPLKTLMICVGAITILIFIALFLFGGKEEGFLKELNTNKRLILAGFIALAGSCLIIAGSRHKKKGILLSFILGGTLLAMPFIFPEVSDSILADKDIQDPELIDIPANDEDKDPLEAQLDKYKNGIGFDKVEAARTALSDPDSLKAVVLRGSKVQDMDTILSYLKQSVGFKNTPVTYNFGREIDGEPVVLITFITDTPLERVFDVTKKFGTPQDMNEIRSTLKIIEVVVNRTTLQGQPTERTSDENHPNYFDANYAELKGIDRSKQLDASRRLQTSTVKGRRADISAALAELINEKDHELSRQAIATLHQWTLPEYKTNKRVLEYAKSVVATDKMSRPVMDYLAEKNVAGSEEVLSKQWASPKGYLLWESYLVRAKEHGEQAVISALPTVSKTHYKSAASILSKVGTAKSLPAINAIMPKASEEDKKYFKASIDEIKSRQ